MIVDLSSAVGSVDRR